MNLNEKIAKRILELRKERGLTAEKLAWYAELSKSAVSCAEQGKHSAKIATIEALCNAMNISLAKFFETFK